MSKKFNFMFTVLCPSCGELVEFNHLNIEVIADGVDIGTCKCGTVIQISLIGRKMTHTTFNPYDLGDVAEVEKFIKQRRLRHTDE